MTRYEHTTLLLKFEKKNFAVFRSDVLAGLASESTTALGEMGDTGWELVSVLPFTSGTGVRAPATDAALAFFKRAAA